MRFMMFSTLFLCLTAASVHTQTPAPPAPVAAAPVLDGVDADKATILFLSEQNLQLQIERVKRDIEARAAELAQQRSTLTAAVEKKFEGYTLGSSTTLVPKKHDPPRP